MKRTSGRNTWAKKLKKSNEFFNKADNLLQGALRDVLDEKDIPCDEFYVCRASGNETVVHFRNDEGCKNNMSDLDLGVMAAMTKSDIMEYFGIDSDSL